MNRLDGTPRVGDMATVVREHCAKEAMVGRVVRVTAIEPAHPGLGLRCKCGVLYAVDMAHAEISSHRIYMPLNWLRRLPPPEEVLGHDLIRAGAHDARSPEELERIAKGLGYNVERLTR